MSESDQTFISNNTVVGNTKYSVLLQGSAHCDLRDNNLSTGLSIYGDLLQEWSHNVSGNTVGGRPLVYLLGASSTVLDTTGSGQVVVVNCSSVSVSGGDFVGAGVVAAFSRDCTVSDITVTAARFGVYARSSPALRLDNITTADTHVSGIFLLRCPLAKLNSCNVEGSGYDGIVASNCNYLTVSHGLARDSRDIGANMNTCDHLVVGDCQFLSNGGSGLYLYRCDHGLVVSSVVGHNGGHGVVLAMCRYTSVLYDSIERDDLMVQASNPGHWEHVVSDCTVDGLPVLFLYNRSDEVVDATHHGAVLMARCNGVTVTGGTLSGGVQVAFSTDCVLEDMCVSADWAGMHLQSVSSVRVSNVHVQSAGTEGVYAFSLSHVTFEGCSVEDCGGTGLYLGACVDCHLTDTIVRNNSQGVYLDGCWESTVTGCTVSDNRGTGIQLHFTRDCLLKRNRVSSNRGHGLDVGYSSSSNWVYLNVIEDNSPDAYDSSGGTHWDDGEQLGNAWGSYAGPGPYTVDGPAGAVDHFPRPVEPSDIVVPHHDPVEVEAWSNGNVISWVPTSSRPLWYEFLVDSVVVAAGPWSGGTISVTFGGLTHGTHTLTLVAYDANYNWAADTTTVNVTAGLAPLITGPDDLELYEGASCTLVWNASDAAPLRYYVMCNGSVVVAGSWHGGPVVFQSPPLARGTYNFTAVVVDMNGNLASDTVIVVVVPTTGNTTGTTPTSTTGHTDTSGLVALALVTTALAIVVATVLVLYLKRRRAARRPAPLSPHDVFGDILHAGAVEDRQGRQAPDGASDH